VRKRCSARVEGVVAGIVQQVLNGRHVEISKAHQTPCEISGIVIRPKDAAKSWVEHRFQRIPAISRTNGTVNPLFFQGLLEENSATFKDSSPPESQVKCV